MSHFLHFLLTLFEFLLGLFFGLTGILLYPGEEGKIQSKFEDFWVRVDDYQKLALSKHAAFLTQIAKLETDFLDLLFGQKLFSVRAFGMSYCCSLLPISIFGMITAEPSIFEGQQNKIAVLFSATVFFSALVSGLISILLRKSRFLPSCLLILYLFTILLLRIIMVEIEGQSVLLKYYPADPDAVPLTVTVVVYATAVLVSFVCDVVYIAVTRSLIRWAGKMTSSFKVIVTIVMDFLLAFLFVSPLLAGILYLELFAAPRYVESPLGDPIVIVASLITIFNLFDLVLAFLFVLLALTLVLHRALWPFLTRSVFRIQDIGTKGRRGILMAVGVALLSWSGVQLPDLVKELLKTLGS